MTTTKSSTSSEDQFESAEGTSASSGAKYAQIEVPNFLFDDTSSNTTSTTTAATTGSFLRLGSFPDIASATGSTFPSGFEHSLLLAKLTGDLSRYVDRDGSTTGTAAFGTTVDTKTSDYHGVIKKDNPYQGDRDYLVGFADDTRSRDDEEIAGLFVKGKGVANTTTNRKAETARLLTKGGSWDHSDGNRITTTGGDKIEIVQGNYKLVVLGRQNPSKSSTNAGSTHLETHRIHVTDVSGGFDSTKSGGSTDVLDFSDYEFSKVYEWLSAEQAWATYEYSNKKRSYKKTLGVDVSLFTGTRKETITGQEPEGDFFNTIVQEMVPTSEDPHVTSYTWSQAMESYTGSMEKAIPETYALSHVIAKNELAFGVDAVAFKWGASKATTIAVGSVDVKLSPFFVGITASLEQISVSWQNLLDIKFGSTTTISPFTSMKLKPKSGLSSGADVALVGAQVSAYFEEAQAILDSCTTSMKAAEIAGYDDEQGVLSVEQHGLAFES